MEKIISTGIRTTIHNNHNAATLAFYKSKSNNTIFLGNSIQTGISRHCPIWQIMLQNTALKTGYNLKQLASNLNLSISTIRRLFKGTIQNPTDLTFRKILGFYCVTFYLSEGQKKQHFSSIKDK